MRQVIHETGCLRLKMA